MKLEDEANAWIKRVPILNILSPEALAKAAYFAGYDSALVMVLDKVTQFCEAQTELSDANGNARFDEEDFQGQSCTASDILKHLKAIGEGLK